MTIPNKKEIIEKIYSMITPEMEKEYFVLCEVSHPERVIFRTGGIKRNKTSRARSVRTGVYPEVCGECGESRNACIAGLSAR